MWNRFLFHSFFKMKSAELSYINSCYSFDINRISNLRKVCQVKGIIGQPRALSALKMGMSVNSKGYNIYISGDNGTGRKSAVRQIASELTGQMYDLAYVYNFVKPTAPVLLVMKSPDGSALYSTMEKVAELVKNNSFDEAVITVNSFSTENDKVRTFLNQVLNALNKHDSQISKYRINLIVNNSGKNSRPVVEEFHCTQENFFGQVNAESEFPHLEMTGGSVLEAAGGFFVTSASQLISHPLLWENLKLFADSSCYLVKDGKEDSKSFIRPLTPVIPVKIIIIGSDELYDKLCENDDQFLRLFKVCAEFDFSMPASDDNVGGTIAYLLDLASKQGLKPVTDDALCELLNYSSWTAEMRDELTAKVAEIGDLLSESDYVAEKFIDAKAVKKAIEERDFANGLTEERINREISNGEMIISLEGSKIGVVNGLAVMDRGLVSFGTPTVISVSVAPGSEGIVNIEHEAGLSGEIHDKGLLILQGYLRKQYARNFPLSIYAGICFEQSYAEVDGDSASSSELFALLSAIGELPVRQDIAVTGSVNQMGDIQPVGGINEKITGFFDICNLMGLTGRQGVIIPKQNTKTLILPSKVTEAIEKRLFHIYPISTIDEGMEILTQRIAGIRNVKGVFPADSINKIIENRLRKLYELSKPA